MRNIFYNLQQVFRLLKYRRCFQMKMKALGFVPIIKTTNETLDKIFQDHCSVSRYGDGEFNIIRGKGNGFCQYDSSLSERLVEVLTHELSNHIVCLPHAMVSQENLNLRTKVFWIAYFIKAYDVIARYIKPDRVYYDASFTRFYFAYKNKNVCKGYLEKIKSLWAEQNVLLVEGEFSCLGVNNDLFVGVHTLQRILCPAKDAYFKYEEILHNTIKYGNNKLILVALGQTATVLCYDLAKLGYWAIDIGHVDIEYEWYLRDAKDKIQIEGKYVNEARKKSFPGKKTKNREYEDSVLIHI